MGNYGMALYYYSNEQDPLAIGVTVVHVAIQLASSQQRIAKADVTINSEYVFNQLAVNYIC